MNNAALQLRLDQHRVHRRAAIVNHDIPVDYRGAGFRVDLDLAAMRTIGIGKVAGQETISDIYPVRSINNLQKADSSISPGDDIFSVPELDIFNGGLKQCRRGFEPFFNHPVGRHCDRRATDND